MQREITMESVFRAGFDSGFHEYDEYADENMTTNNKEQNRGVFLEKRRLAWLEYVKELEADAQSV